jgi:hypothetical protein
MALAQIEDIVLRLERKLNGATEAQESAAAQERALLEYEHELSGALPLEGYCDWLPAT